MDILRSWIIAVLVFLGLNFLISVVATAGIGIMYALPPVMAALAACAYHAERGVGGWARHLLAVFPIPILMNSYGVIRLTGFPTDSQEWTMLLIAAGAGALTAAVGFGIVMLTRLMLSRRSTNDSWLAAE